MKRLILSVAAALVLGACASHSTGPLHTATEAQLQAASIGSFPDAYQNLIRTHMAKNVLAVPDAARYTFDTQPVRAGRGAAPDRLNYRWEVPFKVNPRNALGVYVGDRMYIAHIQNGQITNVFRNRAEEERFDRLQ